MNKISPSSPRSRFPFRLRKLLVLAGLIPLVACQSRIRNTGFLADGYDSFDAVDQTVMKIRFDKSTNGVEDPAYVKAIEEARKRKPTKKDVTPAKEPVIPIDPAEEPMRIVRTSSADDQTTRGVVFIVAEPEWRAGEFYPEDPSRKEEVIFTLRERFYRYLLRAYPHPVRVRYAWRDSDPRIKDCRVITIKSAVTDFKRGDGTLRYALGYGLGQARVQIEAELFEGRESPRRVGSLVMRSAHGGYAQSGWNVEVIEDDYVIKYAVDEAVLRVTKELPAIIPGVELKEPRQHGVEFQPSMAASGLNGTVTAGR